MARRKNKHRQKSSQSRPTAHGSGLMPPGRTGLWVTGVFLAILVVAAAGYLFFDSRSATSSGDAVQQFGQSVEPQQAADPALASLPVAPRVGALAPDFTLTDMDGQQVSLSDFKGQPVVVNFFHTW